MPDRTTQHTIDVLNTVLDMVEQNGASPSGQLPPTEHLRATRAAAGDRARLAEIADAHANGNAPPERNP